MRPDFDNVPSHRPLSLLLAAFLCAVCAAFATPAAVAQEETADLETRPTWRENAVARCEAQHGAEQCADPQFLEENFHVETLDIAHRAAARRSRLEREAMREVTLQYLCDRSPGKTCAAAPQPGVCASQIAQQCQALAREAGHCVANARAQCARGGAGSACVKQRSAQCPSIKKQPLPAVLAKYPKLDPEQKLRIAKAAQRLDAQQSWFSNVLDWIGL